MIPNRGNVSLSSHFSALGYGFLDNGDNQFWMSIFLDNFLKKGILLIAWY